MAPKDIGWNNDEVHFRFTLSNRCFRCTRDAFRKEVQQERLEKVSAAEDVIWVHVVLNGLEHPHANTGDGLSHPLLPKFPH